MLKKLMLQLLPLVLIGLAAASAQAQTCNLVPLDVAGLTSGGSTTLEPYPVTVTAPTSIATATNATTSAWTIESVQGLTRDSESGPNRWLFAGSSTPRLTVNFSPPVAADQIVVIIGDVGTDGGTSGSYNPTYTFTPIGGAQPSDFTASNARNLGAAAWRNPLTYNSSTGAVSKTNPVFQIAESIALVGNSANTLTGFSITASGQRAGDPVAIHILAQTSCVTVSKTSVDGTGTFDFNSTLTSPASTSVTTTTAGTPVTSASTAYLTALHGDVALAETLPTATPAWVLQSASCTDVNGAANGNGTGSFGIVSGSTLTIPAANARSSANLVCSFINGRQAATGGVTSGAHAVPVSSPAVLVWMALLLGGLGIQQLRRRARS